MRDPEPGATRGDVPAADGVPRSVPDRCAYCRRPFESDESSLVLMRDGRPVAAYHERCHPHYRRSGCSAC